MYHLIYRLLVFGALATVIAAIIAQMPLPATAPAWLGPVASFMTQLKTAFAQHSEVVMLFALVTAVMAIAWRRT